MELKENLTDSEIPTATSVRHHRLLENRSTLNKVESEVKGQARSSELDLEHRRNWLPRRRNSSGRATGMTRRCVCNLSQCASTNYMCKSERQLLPDGNEIEGGCFIEDLTTGPSPRGSGSSPTTSSKSSPKPTSARRGCIEMLSREKQELCRSSNRTEHKELECCFEEDMCNYPKTIYSNTLHPTQGPIFPNSVSRIPFEPTGGRGFNVDHEVWLRAAVIAVPICGLIILILLIYVARKLLRSEDDYKQNGSGYHYPQKFHYQHLKAGELLLPNTPHVLDLTAPAPGHCLWCSAPRSTAYLLPDREHGVIDPSLSPDLTGSLWHQLQEDSANHNKSSSPTPPLKLKMNSGKYDPV